MEFNTGLACKYCQTPGLLVGPTTTPDLTRLCFAAQCLRHGLIPRKYRVRPQLCLPCLPFYSYQLSRTCIRHPEVATSSENEKDMSRSLAAPLLYFYSYMISPAKRRQIHLTIQHPIDPPSNLLRHLLSMLNTEFMRHTTLTHDHPRLPVLASAPAARFDYCVSRRLRDPVVVAAEIEHESGPADFLGAPDVGAPAVSGDVA